MDKCPNCPMDDFRIYHEIFRSQLKLRLMGHWILHMTCPNRPESNETPSDIFIAQLWAAAILVLLLTLFFLLLLIVNANL